jgi:hypothetical protein
MSKNISIKVYDPNGGFIKEWANADFSGFSKEINAGLGECVINLYEKFDYTGSELKLGNLVEILVSDKQTSTDGWYLIYAGYISLYEPMVDGGKEGITVHLLGHYTKLSLDILKSGSQTTVYTDSTNGIGTSAAAATDAGKVIRGIIDRYRAETTSPKMFYSAQSIPLVSQNLNYIFEQKTYREALDIAKDACPSGYFYYVNQFGEVYLKSKSTSPTHTFVLGKHFKSVKVERSMEKIRNVMLIWDGQAAGIYKQYKDDASISQYGRRVQTLNDYGIQDSGSADNIGNKFISENKDPDIRVVCEILDDNYETVNGYDIESIEPGDTCRFVGFNEEFADIFRDNMLITQVNYNLDRVQLIIENVKSGIVDQTKKTQDEVNQVSTSGIPTTYS